MTTPDKSNPEDQPTVAVTPDFIPAQVDSETLSFHQREADGWDKDIQPVATQLNVDFECDLPVLDFPTKWIATKALDQAGLLANRYRLGPEIGCGGMGVIYAGWDTQLNREVALKVLQKSLESRPNFINRFLNEAKITSRLQHAGIVAIHELGQMPDSRPFFVMKRVHGETLHQTLSRRDDPTEEFERLLFIFSKVCESVAYAHTNGVIHRDLKPANIMVGEFGSVNVMDWGLAKVLGEPDSLESIVELNTPDIETFDDELTPNLTSSFVKTAIGTVFGTPAYFAPEQARGEINRVDKRADVFTLGGILCEILTGYPPYSENKLSDIYAKAIAADLSNAYNRLDACRAPSDLIKLVKECLSARPEDRPASAVEVAGSVMDYLQSEQRRAERDLVRFFDLSVDLFGIASTEGIFERVNKKFTQVLGYSPEELTSSPFLDFVHPDDKDQTVAQMVKMAEGEPTIQFLNRYRHKRGHYLWFEWNARAILEEQAIYAVARDVTDRVELTEAHRRAEESRLHLSEVVNSADLAIISTNLQGIILSWNPCAEVLFGFSPEEVIGRSLDLLNPAGQESESSELLTRMTNGEQPSYREVYRRRKNGRLIPVSVTISPVRDPEGKVIGISNIARDITDRKRQEAMLISAQQSSRQLAAIVESSNDAIISKDLEGRIRSWNQGAQNLYGYSAEEMIGQFMHRMVPPDHLPEETMILEQIGNGQRIVHFDTVRVHKNGHSIDVSMSVSPIHDIQGRIIGASSTARDITAQKQIERELLLSQSRRAAILDSSLDSIITIDHEGRILDFNQAAERTFGYLQNDVLGKPISEVIIPHHLREAHKRGIKHFLATGEGPVLGKRIETVAIRADGTEFPIELAVTLIKSQGTPTFTASLRDITESRRAADQTAVRFEISKILSESHSLEAAVPHILQTICKKLGWVLGQIFLVAPDKQVLNLLHSWNEPGQTMDEFVKLTEATKFIPGRGLPGRVWTSRKPLWISDISLEKNAPRIPAALRHGIRSATAFPIIVEDEVSGVIEFFSTSVRAEDPDLLVLMTTLGNQIGQFIARKCAEEDLLKSKENTEIANRALQERVRLLALGADIGMVLCQKTSLQGMLQACTDAIVSHLEGSFARIWTLSNSGHELNLRASSGIYTHLDGGHSKIPLGQFKIGRIAQECQPHLTNQAIGDPQIVDQDWAMRQGIVAFAGYPLVVEGQIMGVVAMFSKKTISDAMFTALGSAAHIIGTGIRQKNTEDPFRAESLAASRALGENKNPG